MTDRAELMSSILVTLFTTWSHGCLVVTSLSELIVNAAAQKLTRKQSNERNEVFFVKNCGHLQKSSRAVYLQ